MDYSKKLKGKIKSRLLIVLMAIAIICLAFAMEKNGDNVLKLGKIFINKHANNEISLDTSELFNVDEIIYIDSETGDDNTGDGTETSPYKSLSKLQTEGIITNGKSYTIMLSGGEYTLTRGLFGLQCNKKINIVGDCENTILKISNLCANAAYGTTNYGVNFYRLVWNEIETGTNVIFIRNSMKFYNVVFKMEHSSANYGYFLNCEGNQDYEFYNCTLPKRFDNMLQLEASNKPRLTNCYGGFTSGYPYSSTDTTGRSFWDYKTNYITYSPVVDVDTYRILDDEAVWKNVGTGTNPDGSQANLGVYGGKYSWDAVITKKPKYHLERKYQINLGDSLKLEITDLNGVDENPDNGKFNWSSEDTNIATVNADGTVHMVGDGLTIITGVNKEDNSKVVSTRVYTQYPPIADFPKFDIYYFIDSENGDDTTGDGSYKSPFKTLDRISQKNAIENGYSYGVVLQDGTYELTANIMNLTNDRTVNIIGNKEDTLLRAPAMTCDYGNKNYVLNFYRLVWDGYSISSYGNGIWAGNDINFYNVVFDMEIDNAVYGYFFPYSGTTHSFYNCTCAKKVGSFFRIEGAGNSIKVTNSYGGFTSGYRTSQSSWDYQTNYITSSPSVDKDTYEIMESNNLWENVGTGTNPDGTVANLGVYGGPYSWEYSLDIKGNSDYRLQKKYQINLGESLKPQIFDYNGAYEPLNNSQLIWSSDDESIATVDDDGTIHMVGAGNTKITGIRESDNLVLSTIVYTNKLLLENFPRFDKYVFINSETGNDTTGDGTVKYPFKTLDRISQGNIIQNGYSYGVVLADGTYELTGGILNLTNDKTVNIIGNKENTLLRVPAITSDREKNYVLNFYRLVWDGYSISSNSNGLWVGNNFNFYNVVFDMELTNFGYGCFFPYSGALHTFNNCTCTKKIDSFFRIEGQGNRIQVTNSYGGFTNGYGTSQSSWDYQTNYITAYPSVDKYTYEITELSTYWKNAGTGTNPDGSVADLGVYGGPYSWDYDLEIKDNPEYFIEPEYRFKVGTVRQIEIIDLRGTIENPDESEWTWTSSNEDVATIDSNGKVTGVGIGHTTITGIDLEGRKVKAIFDVYRNSENAITVPMIAEGDFFTVILKEDGTVWTAGLNDKGQLGQGNTDNSNTLLQVKINDNSYLKNVKKISVGSKSAMALTTDGSVYVWGNNVNGQLSQGNTQNLLYATSYKFGENQEATNITDIAMGEEESFVIKDNKIMFGAGKNSSYAINSTGTQYKYAVETEIDKKIIKVATGYGNVMFMCLDGKVYNKGYNTHGELGNGGKNVVTQAHLVGNDINDFDIASFESAYIKEDGSIWVTGYNAKGNLGLGNTDTKVNYEQIPGDIRAKYVDIGTLTLQVLGKDGKVYVCGENSKGQLGVGNNNNQSTLIPMKYEDNSGVNDALLICNTSDWETCWYTDISASQSIIRNDGTVWISGDNTYGQLGNGTNSSSMYLTQAGNTYLNYTGNSIVLDINESINIDNSKFKVQEFNVFSDYEPKNAQNLSFQTDDTNIAVTSTGKITGLSEGFAKVKVTDTDNNIDTYIIVKVVDDKNIALELGNEFSVALTTSGQVWTWGSNSYGELGTDSNSSFKNEPQHILSINNIIDIGAGSNHAVALAQNGDIYTWGLNDKGQLGNGGTFNSKVPVKITIAGNPEIIKVDAYKNTTTALDKNGNVYIWGEEYGLTPRKILENVLDISEDVIITKDREVKRINDENCISGIENAIEISRSDDRIIVLQADGTILNVDSNNQITTLSVQDPVSVSAGNGYGYILTKNKELYTYGTTVNGEIGNGTNEAVTNPTKIDIDNIELLAAGEGNFGGVVNYDGYIFTTGLNDKGQLGHKNTISKNSFEVILNINIDSNVDKIIKKIGENEIVDIGLNANLNLKQDMQGDSTTNITIADDRIAELTKVGNSYKVTGKTIGRTFLNAVATGNIAGQEREVAANVEIRILPDEGTSVPQIKSGDDFTVALKTNGTIETWGKNTYGQLGIGNTDDFDEPQLLTTLNETVAEIAAGNNHVIALTDNGNIYTWGLNNKGQLGNGTFANESSPIQIKLTEDDEESPVIIRVEAHGDNSFAIDINGNVYAWGNNYENKPTQLTNLSNVIDVSTSYFVKADGTAYNMQTLAKLNVVGKFCMIDEGLDHSVLLTTEGIAYGIGSNEYGQLGNGTNGTNTNPVAIRKDGTNIFNNIASIDAGDKYTIILTTSGDVYTVGLNENGKLGIDTETVSTSIPVKNTRLSNVMLISAGKDHAVVAKTDGTTYAWGKGDLGALGNRETKNSIEPVIVGPYRIRTTSKNIVLGKTDEVVIDAKTDYFNIVKEEEISLTTISKNTQVATIEEEQKLEDGYTRYKIRGVNSGTTNVVLTENKTNSNGILQIEVLPEAGMHISPKVETKGNHTLMLKADGTVWTYGQNGYGQLGNGNMKTADEPIQVEFEEGTIITDVAVGEYHNVALDSNGNVWTWGRNNYYQLGVNSVEYSNTPIKVEGLPQISKISAGNNSCIGLTVDNKLVVWGQNAYGELGTGTYSNRQLPTIVNGVHDVLDIKGGKNHYLVVKTTGEIYSVGSNLYGQLGIDLGEKTRTNVFEKIQINAKIGAISAGQNSNTAITIDGTVYKWGQNTVGNLGEGENNITLPVQIPNVTGIVEADNGKTNTILRDYNNNIYIVGQNTCGQIGNGTTNSVSTYEVSTAIDDVLRIGTGNTYTVVMKKDGSVWAWGDYNHGNRALKSKTNAKVPIQVGSEEASLDELEIVVKKSEVKSILTNSQFKFNLMYENLNKTSDYTYTSLNSDIAKVDENGNILGKREGSTWVKMTDKETGKVSVAIIRVIDNIDGYNVYTSPKIATGDKYTATLKEDGNIDIWGYDESGMVYSDVPYTINVLATYINIDSGKNHVVALRNDKTVWSVGKNNYGQLGIGSNVTKTKFVQIPILTDIEKIAAGDNFSVAMDSYGILYVWGEGYGNTPKVIDTNIRYASYLTAGGKDQIILVLPTGEIYGFGSILNGKLQGMTNAVKVDVGNDYLLILDTNGNVYKYQNVTLNQVDGISNAIDISAKDNVYMYQNVNEKVYIWGENSSAQLGIDGTSSYVSTPVQPINNNSDVYTISAGNNNTYIVDTAGYVYSAGSNLYGQIGNGTKEDTASISYGLSKTHTIVGDRNFNINPENCILKINDIEELNIEGKTYNVFQKSRAKLKSEFTYESADDTVVQIIEENNEPTGSIKALTEGLTTVNVTDKVTGQTQIITRRIVPLDKYRIKSIIADGKEAIGNAPTDEEAGYVYGYKVGVPLDDNQNLVELNITTIDNTDSISIDNGETYYEDGTLTEQITFEGQEKTIPVIIKTSNGTLFKYELILTRISNNNSLQSIKVNGFDAIQNASDEDVYEIVITDQGENTVVATAENANGKVAIKGQIATLNSQTITQELEDGYAEVPIKVTSESGKTRDIVLKIHTENELLTLEKIKVDDSIVENYQTVIADDLSKVKVYAESKYDDIYVSIDDKESTLHTKEDDVNTENTQTQVKIKLQKTTKVDGIEKLISREYNLDIYKNKMFTKVGHVKVNGQIIEEENNTYTAYVLSNVQTAGIEITSKDNEATITLEDVSAQGKIELQKDLEEENSYQFTVEDTDGNTLEYTLRIEKGSTDTKIKKITVEDENYTVRAEKTDEKIEEKEVYEARIIDTHSNVAVTVQTANSESKIEINNSGNLTQRMCVENLELNSKETLVPILVKTEDEATQQSYYLRIIRQSDDTSINMISVNESLENEDIEATVDSQDEDHYEVNLINAVREVKLNVQTVNENTKVSINGEDEQLQNANADIPINSSTTDVQVKVTSELGTEKIYYVTIYTISDEADLQEVKVDDNIAEWNNKTNRYEIKVDRGLTQYQIKAKATNEKAKVSVNGVENLLETITTVARTENETIVNINVLAPNQINSQTKQLAIIEKSNNKEAGYVKVDGKTLLPDTEGNYNVDVISTTESVLIEVGAQDSNAFVNLDGESELKAIRKDKTLQSDNDMYETYIIAEDGNTTGDHFFIKINRLDGNKNIEYMKVTYTKNDVETTKEAELKEDGTYYVKIPRVEEDVVALKVKLEKDTSMISVYGTETQELIYGYVNLQGDITQIPMTITSQDGTTVEKTLIIEKESTDTSLVELSADGIQAVKIGNGYVLDVDSKATKISLTARPTNQYATVGIVGEDEYLPTLSEKEINIEGINQFLIEVIAEDRETTNQYIVTLVRKYNTSINNITVNGQEVTLGDTINVIESESNVGELVVETKNDDANIKLLQEDVQKQVGIGTLREDIDINEEQVYTYLITVQGTGEYSETISTYTLNVRRKSTNNNATILLDNQELTLNEDTRIYEAKVVTSNHLLRIVKESNFAQVQIESEDIYETQFVLDPRQTITYTIKVIAEDETEKEYIVSVYRKSDDASIDNVKIKLSQDEEEETLQKQLDDNYYKKISRHQESIFVTLIATDEKATAYVNNEHSLHEVTKEVAIDENAEITNVTLEVVAEDGTINLVNLQFEKESNNTELNLVKYGQEILTEENEEYTIEVDDRITTINLSAEPLDSNAKIRIVGDLEYVSTINERIVDIDGKNTVGIEVIAEDNETTKIYPVNIRKIFDTKIDNVLVDTNENVEVVNNEYKAFVSATNSSHTVEIRPSNELAVITVSYNGAVLKTGTGIVTFNDSFEGNEKTYDVKVQGPEGKEEFVTNYTVKLTKKSQDTTAQIYMNENLLEKDNETGKYKYITQETNNTLKVITNNEYAEISIAEEERKLNIAEAIYSVNISETKEIIIRVYSQNGESEEYKVELIRLNNNTNITKVEVNDIEASNITESIFRSVQENTLRNAHVVIKAESNLTSITANVNEENHTNKGELELNIALVGYGTKQIPILLEAEDGTRREYSLSIVQNTSEEINVNVEVNNLPADKLDDSTYRIFIENTYSNASVHLYGEDYITITAEGKTGSDVIFNKVLNTQNDVTLVQFTTENVMGASKDNVLFIIKESNDNSVQSLSVNGMEITKDNEGRYRAYIENTEGNPTVKVKTTNEYANVKIGTNEKELRESEKVVPISDSRITTIPIMIFAQSGKTNIEYLDIITTFTVGKIDSIIIDDVEVSEYDEETKTYTALVENGIVNHEIVVVADNSYVTLELEGAVGLGTITSNVTFEEGQEIKEMTLYVTGETDLTQTYTLIMAQKSNNVDLTSVKVNDVILTEEANNIYRKNINLGTTTVKIEAIAEYPYARVKVGDSEVKVGASGEVWLNTEITQDETTIPIVVTAADGITNKTYNIILTRKATTISGKVITENYEGRHSAEICLYRTADTRKIEDEVNPREMVSSIITNEDGTYKIDAPCGDIYDVVIRKEGYLVTTIKNINAKSFGNTNVQDVKLIAGEIQEDGEIEISDLVGISDKLGVTITELNEGTYGKYDLNEDGIIDIKDRNILKLNYSKKAETLEWDSTIEEGFIKPMACDYVITSSYGSRVNPITGVQEKHTGIDISGTHHTEIYVVRGGEITYAGVNGGYGNCVEIKHVVDGETIYSFYAHLSEIDVEEGQEVRQGDVVGLEGGAETDPNHGNSTGHHLHFEIRTASGYGNDVDPTGYIEF